MNHKNSITGEIISAACYQKLPAEKQWDFSEVGDSPTHTANKYNDGFILHVLPSSIDYTMIEGLNDSSGGAYNGF